MKLFTLFSVQSDEEDTHLMESVKSGDRAAFQTLYEKYRKPIMSFLGTLVRDSEVVDELFQETFLKLYRSRDRYERRAKFSTFLWTIAKHTAFDWIEKKKETLIETRETDDGRVTSSIEESLASVSPDAERALIEGLDAKHLEGCIERLSPRDRLLCGLRMHSELSYEEISEQIGEPIGTVKTRLFRIREKLARCFRAKGGDG